MQTVTPSNLFKDQARAATVGKGRGDWKYKAFSYLLLTLIVFTITIPFMWMISTSFKPESEILRRNLFPETPTLSNYTDVITKTELPL